MNMALIVTLAEGEPLHIGEAVVTVLKQRGRHCKVSVEADKSIRVLRNKVQQRIVQGEPIRCQPPQKPTDAPSDR
jgi:sRNA-binding carbon storage regulator CsrA